LTGRALTHLGMIALLSGQMDTALGYLREAAEVLRGGRYQAEGVLCLFVLGDAARAAGNPGLGARALLAAEAVRARIGTPEWPYAVGLLETLRSELGPEGIDSLTAESHEGELFAMIEETHAAVSALGRGPEPVPVR